MNPAPSRLLPLLLSLAMMFQAFATTDVIAQEPEGPATILIAPALGYDGDPPGSTTATPLTSWLYTTDEFPEDPWLRLDKFLHTSVSFLLTLSAQYAYETKFGMAQMSALPISMFSASVVGIGKEVYDWQLGPSNYFSANDLAANSVGILIGATFIIW